MKVTLLRATKAFKNKSVFIAEKGTEIERVHNGDMIVRMPGLKPILIAHQYIEVAELEDESMPAREYVTKVPVSELKK